MNCKSEGLVLLRLIMKRYNISFDTGMYLGCVRVIHNGEIIQTSATIDYTNIMKGEEQ